jgi:hypothetical protein
MTISVKQHVPKKTSVNLRQTKRRQIPEDDNPQRQNVSTKLPCTKLRIPLLKKKIAVGKCFTANKIR